MNENNNKSVAVIGAGIIGLMNALQLAKRGIKVTIIDNIDEEKRSFKVGESLLVFGNMFIRTVCDLREFVRTENFPKGNLWFNYGMERSNNFEEKTEFALELTLPEEWGKNWDPIRKEVMGHDIQICRPDVEAQMFASAHAHPNITFHDKGRVKDVELNKDGNLHEVLWVDKTTNEKRSSFAHWVIDCSGRYRLLARKFGHDAEDREFDDDFKTTAVWAQFENVTDAMYEGWSHHFEDGDVMHRQRSTLHMWGKGYWVWVIRLSHDRVSIGATFDNKYAPPGKPREQFWNIIKRFPIFDTMLSEDNLLEFQMFRKVQHCTDTFVSARRYGMVGDAASIVDAYYSQGMSMAFVTSWHIANIIEKDFFDNSLDIEYIDRVNTHTTQDWKMLRNLVKFKFGEAIADARFFILSHVLDQLVVGGMLAQKHFLSRWLFETDGDPKKETTEHKKIRKWLEKNLYYTRGKGMRLVGKPQKVQEYVGRLQRKMAERAIWRMENNIKVAKARTVIRFPSGLAPIQNMFKKDDAFIDVSPESANTPAALHYKGTEKHLLTSNVVYGLSFHFWRSYFLDWRDTRRLRRKLQGNRPSLWRRLKDKT